MKGQADGLGAHVTAGTLHNYMLHTSGKPPHGTFDGNVWQEAIPQLALEKLTDPDVETPLFDELIIDEGQDILRESYLDVLDASLKGGLAQGRWRMFGDFETQAIFSSADISLEKFIASRGSYAPLYRLATNCRNTPRVSALASGLVENRTLYGKTLRPDDGTGPEIRYYDSPEEQNNLLSETLEGLRPEAKEGSIVILSTMGNQKSTAAQVGQPWKDRLAPYQQPLVPGCIPYSSIHAFKGLEAPAVILTDVDTFDRPTARNLFYIAATRVLDRLIVLANKQVRPEMESAL